MKCQADVETRREYAKTSTKVSNQETYDEIEPTPSLTEMRRKTMNLRRDFTGMRQYLPNMAQWAR